LIFSNWQRLQEQESVFVEKMRAKELQHQKSLAEEVAKV
jgi:hypothetical protein